MTLDVALEKARKELMELPAYVVGARSRTDFDGSKFKLPFFNKFYFITHPDIAVTEDVTRLQPPQWLELIMLHYLITADGTPIADKWIAYRQLPGAFIFEQRFSGMAVEPLLKAYGNDIEGFKTAGQLLKGVPISRVGDAGFMFDAFPLVRMACILYLGDEDVGPSINILYDASVSNHLHTEDLSYLGSYLAIAMQERKGNLY
ncbi:MAG: DUF3786 domain-containing protein [Dehalococcoidia bacterium]|nr:DUF3786 domain-containing protein [Dehalococcoidia bacterium]